MATIPGPAVAISASGQLLAQGPPGPAGLTIVQNATVPIPTRGALNLIAPLVATPNVANNSNDIGITPGTNGQVLTMVGGAWVPANSSGGVQVGLASARPTATGSGKLYRCLDFPVEYFDSAPGVWQQFVGSSYTPAAPAAGTWTTIGGIAVSNAADLLIAGSTVNTDTTICALQAGSVGATGVWCVTFAATFGPVPYTAQGPELGVCVANGVTSGTSAYQGLSIAIGSSELANIQISTGTIGSGAETLFNQVASAASIGFGNGRVNFRLLNDGVVQHYQVSADGSRWVDWVSGSPLSGATDYGFFFGYADKNYNWQQSLIYTCNITTPTQYTVSVATSSSNSVLTIGAHPFRVGDLVAIQGALGTTNLNTSSGATPLEGCAIVTAIGATTITTTQPSSGGAYTANSAKVTPLSF